ncbi:hypothetical protein Zmor_000493 [Zophobas morio]|uniref:Odorant receptor n=1 Tax=Zophobas morio TaxID=2755281 RepID=A0AA38IXJ2_9CUCU|nr:hypothetical protein Zmor_000493 [Zophobas morio]
MFIQMMIDIQDLSKVSETLFFFLTHSTYMCKMVNFLFNKRRLIEIEDQLSQPVFYEFPMERLKILIRKVEATKSVALTFRIMCSLAVVLSCLMPYVDPNKRHSLPLSGWLPYNTTKYYYPTVAFQVTAVCYTAANNVNFDSLTWILITIASAEFDILKENLKNLDYKGDKLRVGKKFNDCVNHHKEIVRFVYKIESTFSKGIFLTFLASVVVICFTGFMMIIVPFLGPQFIFLTVYLSCMMTEVAVYCWYGHDVMTTSDEIGNFFYTSNWYESELSLRQSMAIFLERTKKPVTLTGGKLVVLSLPTFTSILRSSYSYFAVLQHLYYDS